MIVTITYPGQEVEEIEVDKNEVIIGRGASCDVTINEDAISRKHLEVHFRDDGLFYIKDLTLSNWVSYNDDKLSKVDFVQYFDFASLILPGNISLKISNDSSDDETHSKLVDELNQFGEQPVEKKDIYKKDVSQNQRNQRREKRTGKGKRSRRSRNNDDLPEGEVGNKQFLVITIILLVVGGYLTNYFYSTKEEVNTVIGQRVEEPVKKKKKRKRRRSVQQPAKEASSTGSSEVESQAVDFSKYKAIMVLGERFITNNRKCRSNFERSVCRNVVKGQSGVEGFMAKPGIGFIYKDISKASRELYNNPSMYKQLLSNDTALNAMVANILEPTTVLSIGRENVKQVLITFIDQGNGNSVVSQHIAKIQLLEKVNQTNYSLSISEIQKKSNYNDFNENYLNKILRVK